MSSHELIKVALTDDHILLRNALASLIDSFGDCKVVLQAGNGQELLDNINPSSPPDIAIVDLNMPEMDGFETARRLNEKYPKIRILMLTMYDSELALIRLLQNGVKGFLKKDIHPSELKFAIHSVAQNDYYYSNYATGKLFNLFKKNNNENSTQLYKNMLSEIQIEFLKLVTTDLTYKEIALKMKLNPRSIDTLRDNLFAKLDVKSRVGLAIFALRHGLVRL